MASSLFRRSLALLSAAILAAALVFTAVGLSVLGAAYSKANSVSLLRAATALAASIPALEPGAPGEAAAAAAAKRMAESGYRVTLILADGRVLADSEADPGSMENHATRPEVAAALAGRPTSIRRMSTTVGEELLYAASPLVQGGATLGVLRLAIHEPSLERAFAPSRWSLALASLAFAAAAIAAAAAFARMTVRPLASLAAAARAYGSGEWAAGARRSVRPDDPEEIRLLAETLDSMAADIGQRMRSAEEQRRELEAILDAMAEAVIALDSNLRIRTANSSASALFGLEGKIGTGLLEATRSSDLQAVAADCLASGVDRKAGVSLFLPAERFFQVFASPLGGPLARPGGAGVVIALNDVTELRRLERVRRDFVANVSHELRTPVQLVKGFAESLGEGDVDDPERAKRYMGIIGRNAARMESLIGDLLSLASLEREGRERLDAELVDIAPILLAAREAIGPKAEDLGTEVQVDCEPGLSARVDAGLLEQALVNLIDNAVKYSAAGTVVRVTARSEGGALVLEVRDRGIGIPASDLPRIFERFYRVDKARSRELGGTGLGLAIVRHIALAHGGEVSVESYEGEGSTFRMRLPL